MSAAAVRWSLGLVACVLVLGACGDGDVPGVCRGVDGSGTAISEGPGQWERRGKSPEFVELWRAGGLEEGPGEFSAPEDLELTADGRVLVADRDRELEVFRLEGGRLRFVDRFPIDVTPWDTCVLDDRLVVQGIRHAVFQLPYPQLSVFSLGPRNPERGRRAYTVNPGGQGNIRAPRP